MGNRTLPFQDTILPELLSPADDGPAKPFLSMLMFPRVTSSTLAEYPKKERRREIEPRLALQRILLTPLTRIPNTLKTLAIEKAPISAMDRGMK